jgi:hypothetical protein
MFHFPRMGCVLAVAWLLCGLASQAQQFTNGGFEIIIGAPIPSNSGVTLNPGDTWLPGWSAGGPDGTVTVQNGYVGEELFGTLYGMTPWQGDQWVIFPNDSPGGSLSQTFLTPIGDYCTISFGATFVYLPDYPAIGVTVEASDGSILTNNVYELSWREWTAFQLSFLATTATATLTFYDASTNADGADIGLDGVALVLEPPGWPYVITSPESETNGAGSMATFTASAGGEPSTVQWYLGTDAVPDGTNTTLTVIASGATAGSYTAEFSNSEGTSVSEAAILTVLEAVAQPFSQTANAGVEVTFYSTPNLSGTTLQWFNGPNPIPGATTPFLTVLANNQTAGSYTAQFSLGTATASSAAALLTVLDIPFINGSFEDPSIGPDNDQVGNVGDTWLTGWTFGGSTNAVFVFDGPFLGLNAADGNQWVVFDSENAPPGGVVSQTFSTTVGQGYLVTFSAMAMDYSVDGDSFKSLSAAALASDGSLLANTGVVPPTDDWSSNQLIFTAQTINTTLAFTDTSTPAAGPSVALDAVTVVDYVFPPPPVPTLTLPASQPASGSIIVRLAGQPGQTCIMETSTNLRTWFPVSTNILTSSTAIVTNVVMPGATRQFWTVVPAP